MKQKKHWFSLVLLLALTGLFLPGCALFTGESIPEETMAAYVADAKDIAEFGTRAALLENKDYRKELEATRDSLAALEALPDGKITIDDLTSALSRLPLEQLKSEKGQLYVLGGRVLFRRVTRSFSVGDVTNLKPIVAALRQGIETGLQ